MPLGVPFITAHRDYIDLMECDHVKALLLHEEGHIVCGHTERYTQLDHHLEDELEADQYAAEFIGKTVLRDALVSVIETMGRLHNLPSEKIEKVVDSCVHANPAMKPRFDALV